MAYKTKKNLLGSRDVYNRYYGDFRGVDFSSDHTQVHEQRLAYAVNMYKDYQSGQGQALETIAGFRRRVELPEAAEIFGIHHFEGAGGTRVLIHAGTRLYLWRNYPRTVNVVLQETVTLPEESAITNGTKTFAVVLGDHVEQVVAVSKLDGEDVTMNASYEPSTRLFTVSRSDLSRDDTLYISYLEGVMREEDVLFFDMNARKSTSFVFNNRLFLIDGKNYLVYDGETISAVVDAAYVPTTYINIIPSGENADIGTEYEQRNILDPRFRHTFIADGTTVEFHLNENLLEGIDCVTVYGKEQTEGSDYTVDLENGMVTFKTAPGLPADNGFPEFYAGIEITARKTITRVSGVTAENADVSEIGNLICRCTIAATFDNRVFLSGNPDYPNHVFYCARNLTGYVDPSYFGVLNYMQDGVGSAPVTGMIPVADTLMVLKADTRQDSATYFHTASLTGIDLQPVIYPAAQGLAGIGCLGASVNFLDDPIFVSRLGVEAVGQLSVRYERAIEHRSSLIDAKLVNMDLASAVLEEWNGYLLVLVDGRIFMADSRQRYTHEIGVPQYEWYYLEDIGIYTGQYDEYRYATQIHSEMEGRSVRYCTKCKCAAADCVCGNEDGIVTVPITLAEEVYDAETDETSNLLSQVANAPDADGCEGAAILSERIDVTIDEETYAIRVFYKIHEVYSNLGDFVRYEAHLCYAPGNKTGGVFRRATVLRSMENNLFFGTENGVLCSFNFDMRDETGEIAPRYYTFDGRTILSGCATKMDCCGVPHLNKNTVKKSTVIKTKTYRASAAKIRVRTNRKPYEQIARINSTLFSFDGMDFTDFSFSTTEQSLFAIKEKEKKWVEKQYYVYSDEYMKPFALFYISFRYSISGRYKG